ncbi:MAG: YqgE/AlgH family protein [Gammaproteobacteria bacterium]|nr:YqgE/AlgH family protein [Gammaproteobacteria bacterium]
MLPTTLLTNHFLIAMPALADPNFHHTVTYLCEHNSDGAMGVVINRPLDLTFGVLLEHLEITGTLESVKSIPIYQGGPVQTEHGFVLHEGEAHWHSSLHVTDTIALTASQDIIEAIARGKGPRRFLIVLGYAGWGKGQLEQELVDNAWLSGPADPAIIFTTPEAQRWSAAAALLGVEIGLLSPDTGHA